MNRAGERRRKATRTVQTVQTVGATRPLVRPLSLALSLATALATVSVSNFSAGCSSKHTPRPAELGDCVPEFDAACQAVAAGGSTAGEPDSGASHDAADS